MYELVENDKGGVDATASGWLTFTKSLVDANDLESLAAAMNSCPDKEFDDFEFDEEYQIFKHHQVFVDIFKVGVMLDNILLNSDAAQSFIPEIYDTFEELFERSWDAWKILAGIEGDDEGQIEAAELE